MDRRTRLLLGLGSIALVSSLAMGAPWTGYGTGTAPLLFRIGIIYLFVGGGTVLVSPVTPRRAFGTVVAALGVVFVVGVGTMYYDLGVTPPAYAGELTLGTVLRTQATFVALLGPVGAGYVCGVLLRRNQTGRSLLWFGASIVGGWFLATALTYAGGTQAEFASLYYVLVILAASITALPLLTLMARRRSQRPGTAERSGS